MNSIGIRRVSFTTSMAVIGYIYQIISDMTDRIYIGSTKKSIEQRFNLHKRQFKSYKGGKSHYVASFEIVQYPDARIDILEVVYEGENIKEIEQAHIDDNPNAVNMQRAAPRPHIHHCDVCNIDIKLSGKHVKGGYSSSHIRRHERSKKHQSKLSVV